MANQTSSNVVRMAESSSPQVTGVGFSGLENLTEDEFFEVGNRLSQMERGMQWAIGDWYNAIPWGDKESACERVSIKCKTAKDYARVCGAFQMDERSSILTFQHYRHLAHSDLTDADRRSLMAYAEEEEWSAARLKKERDIILGLVKDEPDEDEESFLETIRATLPASATQKTVRAVEREVKKIRKNLLHGFDEAVEAKAKERVATIRQELRERRKEVEAQEQRIVDMKVGVKAFLSKEEFALIRGCLHPDRNPDKKAGKAFKVFNKLEDIKNW